MTTTSLAQRIGAAAGQGRPLDPGLRRTLEHGLGGDLARLRLHTGTAADDLARALGADAFTSGWDVFFRRGAYDPRSAGGLRLLAHEAAHGLQQAWGLVQGHPTAAGLCVSAPGDPGERAAERAAERVLAGDPAPWPGGSRPAPPRSGLGPLPVQRHSSWEHRILGDVPTADVIAVAQHAASRQQVLERERQLMWLWHQSPDQVSEATIAQLCPWVRTLRLPSNNVLLTYGELNSLPDYLANPTVITTMPGTIVEPILQLVRQQSYNRINGLLGQATTDRFAGSVCADWGEGLFNTLYETVELDNFTWNLGINHSDHYKGLLARNACHFAPFAWWRWNSFYLIARDLAAKAYQATDPALKAQYTYQAWLNAGYADHFLQDSFAAGHLINKTLIMQWFVEWAAHKWYVPVVNWDQVTTMTSQAQPGLAGLQLYWANSGSTDPQTAEELPTEQERMLATGVRGAGSGAQATAYQNYLTFLDGAVVQASSAALHDYFNEKSLWVSSQAKPNAYQIWGDDTMLTGGDGVGYASAATHISQQSIAELLASGSTTIQPHDIQGAFPTNVRAWDGSLVPLQQWHTDEVRALCEQTVFPAVHYYILRPAALAHLQYVSQDQGAPPPDGVPGDATPLPTVDTLGWDAVYATTFEAVNRSLTASGKLPSSFQGSEDSSGSATGEWGAWTLISGSPSNLLWLQCKVASGTLTTATGTTDLSGSSWTAQFGLTLVQGSPLSGNTTTWSLSPTASGAGAPRLVAQSAPNVTGADVYILTAIMEQVLRQHVAALGEVFGSIVLGDASVAPDQPWLAPTAAAFACESLPAGDQRLGIFALPAMTEGRSAARKQVAVDRRVLDDAPDGTNAALVLGPSLVVSRMLQPAIQGLVQGSSADDSTLDVTGTVVYNKGPITWGAFTYDMGDDATATIHPRIDKGNVELALDGGVVHLSMSNVNFPYPGWSGPGEITVAFSVQQFITFIFVVRDDGQIVMVPDLGAFNTSFNVTITPSEEEQIFQIALSAATQVLLAVVGGVIESAGEAIGGALEETAGGAYEAELGDIELQTFVGEADSVELETAEQGAAEEGGQALANAGDAGYLQKFKGAIIANKWKIFATVLDKMVTIPVGQTSNIAVWAAQLQFDDLPTLNPFVAASMSAVRWPTGVAFTPTGGSLQGALVLWGAVGAEAAVSRPEPVLAG